MRRFFIIHGVVQGVGYRNLVRNVAAKYNIKGMVRNVQNGSVEILAEADPDFLNMFENEISVTFDNGPQVLHIESYSESDTAFPKEMKNYDKFVIEGSV